MYLVYDLIFSLLFIISLPIFLLKMIKGKYRDGFWQRFGFLPAELLNCLKEQPVVWIHAVSVGETVAASPLVKEIKKNYPEYTIVFSNVTDTGQDMARKIIKEADAYFYFPLDLSIVVKKVLSIINPSLVVIMETELWPNFLHQAKQKGIRVMLANGRISDNSASRYKWLGPYLKNILNDVDIFSMQSELDVDYLRELGANEEKVYNNGNTKLDQTYAAVTAELKAEYYKEFKIDSDQPVLVVGSTHANEEEQFIKVFKELRQEFNELVMVLAPRHIKRTAEIEKTYLQAGLKVVRRTSIKDRSSEEVILLDTIGELARIYSLAALVFVGGSLIEKGGHNILEPAVHSKLVFFGPHMFNFKDATQLLLSNNVAIQINNQQELIAQLRYFLKNPQLAQEYGEKAGNVIKKNQGASLRNLKLIDKLLN